MKIINKIVLSVLVLVSINMCVKPISEQDAAWWGKAVGGGVAAGGLLVGGGIALFSQGDPNGMLTGALIGIGGLGLGALSGYALYKMLLEYTPQRKYERAKKLLDEVASDSLVAKDFPYVENFVVEIGRRFRDVTYPLVLAERHLYRLSNKVTQASILLHSAYDEASKNVTLISLCNKCVDENQRVEYASNLIDQRIAVILKCTNYNDQKRMYEEYKREQERIAEERRKRWQKERMHDDKMRQKERDRRQKQNFLDRVDPGNVGVNVNL